ncbi:DUF459 domain-containing protein [Oxalicibacterium faecigallinarum]|uniref:SGNH hydrolase-type esterase domain-containing protein n=1 Tax=Oxalicibacterium faecigallinarum TaxID=573741 RepID=A0A8J3AVA1_9BURK|nr:GDSL-type esterase/lipase family protein [Oxalicibacterium faecigallinarum]GGI20600.1 hypothetical protein GCM10008066_24840 [Oxalicibacterium faecigallinarum]
MLHTPGDQRICFVGDSFVQGTGDPLCLGWAGRLAQRAVEHGVNLTHYNLGIRRDTSRDILARWRQECAARLPSDCAQRVVFSFGVNDTSYDHNALRVAPGESLANLQTILSTATTRYHVLMVGPPPMPDPAHTERIARLDRQFADLADVLSVPYLSIWEALRNDAYWLQEAQHSDGAHPGRHGYDTLADMVQRWEGWWFR